MAGALNGTTEPPSPSAGAPASAGSGASAGHRMWRVLGVIAILAIVVVGLGLANVIPGFHLSPASKPNPSGSGPPYTVRMVETGLASGTSWSVTLGGKVGSSTGTAIEFVEPAGTFSYSVATLAGYTPSPSKGTVTVTNANVSLSVTFMSTPSGTGAPTMYPVMFEESGLASSTSWTVTFNGSIKSSTAAAIEFSAPNGSFAYSILRVAGYATSAPTGTATVTGSAVSVPITFTSVPPAKYSVTFSESGLPAALNWSVTLAGSLGNSTGSTIAFTETNGTYYYSVGPLSVYLSTPGTGTVTVDGANVTVPIGWSHVAPPSSRYQFLNFTQTGLANNTTWGPEGFLTASGSAQFPIFGSTGEGAQIGLTLPNGTYYWSIQPVAEWNGTEYFANPSNGSVTIAGSAVTIAVHFGTNSSGSGGGTNTSSTNYTVTVTEYFLPSGTQWLAGAQGSAGGFGIGIAPNPISLNVSNGTYKLEAFAFAGYSPVSLPNFTVAGGPVNVSVDFVIDYLVTFYGSGVSNTTLWGVTVNGSGEETYGPGPIGIFEPNGTYPYAISAAGYIANPASGTVSVAGTMPNITFTLTPLASRGSANATFSETGLPVGTNWIAELVGPGGFGGANRTIGAETNGTSLRITAPIGNYSWIAATAQNTWYWATTTSGAFELTDSGVTVGLDFVFRANVTPIVFEEVAGLSAGIDALPNGTTWGVDLLGTTLSTTGMILVFLEPNESYSYTVSAPSGYYSLPGGGSFTIDNYFLGSGTAIDVYVAFFPGNPPSATPSGGSISAPVGPHFGTPSGPPSLGRLGARSFGAP